MKTYMVFSRKPPLGYGPENELLVSLTRYDIEEAYDEEYRDERTELPWADLPEALREEILADVGNQGIDLHAIFDHYCFRIGGCDEAV